MWNHCLQMESLTCWGMWWIKSYSINVATMNWKCFSCYFENDRIRTAYLGWNVNQTASSGHQYNLLVLVRTDQPSVWDIQERGILYNAQWKWRHYIPTDVRHKFSSAVHSQKKSDQGCRYCQSSIMKQYVTAEMTLVLSWSWWAVPASQLSWWVVENHDNRRILAVACIVLQALPFNWQLVTDRFCNVSSLWMCYWEYWCYVNQWVLHIIIEKQDVW